jgi:hypothetical protein
MFEQAIAATVRRDYLTALIRLASVPMVQNKLRGLLPEDVRQVLKGLQKYGITLAQIAEADKAEDVTTILENAAAPVGSWREYRRRKWPGFISAILGIAGGFEWAKEEVDGGFAAAALPIGVETGRHIGKDFTFNVFFSLIDLGALTNVRLDEASSGEMGTTGTPQAKAELGFASVIAPGIFLEFGISNSPFVIGGGVQLAPAARTYFECPGSAACEETKVVPGTRLLVFLGVDLPAFPLW